jgi:hypothetical protein
MERAYRVKLCIYSNRLLFSKCLVYALVYEILLSYLDDFSSAFNLLQDAQNEGMDDGFLVGRCYIHISECAGYGSINNCCWYILVYKRAQARDKVARAR